MPTKKKTTKSKVEKIEIKVDPLRLKKMKVTLKGMTPLLMDRLPESVKEQILAKQTGVAKSAKKKVRDTAQEVKDAIHVTSTGKIGFPAAGFKAGMMECTSFVGDKFFSKKLVSGAVKIINVVDGLVPIKYKKQTVLKHNIEHNTKFSPCFHGWSTELEIVYDANNISPQDIVTLLDHAGFYVGIGAWRSKCKAGGSGEYGAYEVSLKESKLVKK